MRKGLMLVMLAFVATACHARGNSTTGATIVGSSDAAATNVTATAPVTTLKPSKNATTTTTRQGGIEGLPVDSVALALGECFNKYSFLQGFQPVEITTRRPCEQPHDAEVFVKVDYPGSDPTTPFPGKEKLVNDTIKICYQSFSAFVGMPFETSIYQLSYIVPPKERWEDPVEQLRSVICYLTGPTKDTKLTGSARGSKL